MNTATTIGPTPLLWSRAAATLAGLSRPLLSLAHRFFAASGALPPASDEELFASYRNGNQAAFGQLFDRYSAALLRFMRRQIHSREDAADLVQQTFLQLHRARNDFREGAALRPWLYTIALNLRREYFRSRARRPETVSQTREQEDETTPEDTLKRSRLSSRVQEALAELPEGQRLVIELHWFEGASFPEVAAMLGLGLSAVKVRAHRGYGALRQTLTPPVVQAQQGG